MTEATTTEQAANTPRARYEETDAAIMRAEGLMFAYYELWSEATCIDFSKPAANSMGILLNILRETLQEIQSAHSREWQSVREMEGRAA